MLQEIQFLDEIYLEGLHDNLVSLGDELNVQGNFSKIPLDTMNETWKEYLNFEEKGTSKITNIQPYNYLLPPTHLSFIFSLHATNSSKSSKITKQKKPKVVGGIAQRKNFTNEKCRTNLPKRCGHKACKHGQHYFTVEEAINHMPTFETTKNKNTYCPCGDTVQYFIDGKWLRSAALSKHENKKKIKN